MTCHIFLGPGGLFPSWLLPVSPRLMLGSFPRLGSCGSGVSRKTSGPGTCHCSSAFPRSRLPGLRTGSSGSAAREAGPVGTSLLSPRDTGSPSSPWGAELLPLGAPAWWGLGTGLLPRLGRGILCQRVTGPGLTPRHSPLQRPSNLPQGPNLSKEHFWGEGVGRRRPSPGRRTLPAGGAAQPCSL